MKKIKKSTGITLIALIITVIVMIILVGVTVNVALNGGLFDTAKQAASGMEMAQIRERAEVVKANLFAEAQSNNSIILSKTELKNRLLQEFEGSTSEGSKVIVEDGKYDIIIKNTDLDLDVVEHSDNIEANELVDFSYDITNMDSEEKTYGINVKLNIKALMTVDEYKMLKESQEITEDIPYEEKKKEVLEYMYNETSGQVSSIDEYIVFYLNSLKLGVTHDNIDDWLVEPILLDALQKESITKEQLYAGLATNGEKDSITEEELVEILYKDMFSEDYSSEYYMNTQGLNVYLIKDGKEELLYNNLIISTNSATKKYIIAENGTYQFEIRTREGNTIESEVLKINNIEQDNPYVLTEEEANGTWTTDGNGTLTKYYGQEKTVFIPIKIGNETINNIGPDCLGYTTVETVKMLENIISIKRAAFGYNENLKNINISESVETIDMHAFIRCNALTSIIIPKSVTSIGEGAFYSCASLEEVIILGDIKTINKNTFAFDNKLVRVTLPNSVTSINSTSFTFCTNLTNIYFAPGDNPIPTGQPWGAPNENLVVTKLTE